MYIYIYISIYITWEERERRRMKVKELNRYIIYISDQTSVVTIVVPCVNQNYHTSSQHLLIFD